VPALTQDIPVPLDPTESPRACIITPGQIGSNPRVVKEAQTLHDAGFRVTVVATRTLDRVEPRDRALMQRIDWPLVRIDLRSRPRWRTERAFQIAARRAHSLTALAWFVDLGFSAFTRPLMRATADIPAELYIAHYPAALPAAAAAARRHGALYAYDAEDFHLGDLPDNRAYDQERRLIGLIEGRYLPGCAYVTASAPCIADAYVEAFGIRRPQVVLNVFPLCQAPAGPTARGSADPKPSVYWFSQTIGPDRGLECAVRAIGAARTRPHLYLRGSPVSGFVEELERIAADIGAAGRLHILPPDQPDEMERLAAAYDVGLVAETGQSRNRQICLTNKLFSFLLAGVPPLMSGTPAHQMFASQAGMTDWIYPVDDAKALADLLDVLLSHPDRLTAARAEAWRLGQERYNWERESGFLIDAVTAGAPWPNINGKRTAERSFTRREALGDGRARFARD
jgi:glycosyltransferase involved in cell wall biosynthesis